MMDRQIFVAMETKRAMKLPLFRSLLVWALGCLLSTSSFGVVYYVSPNGSDTNTGTSSTAPWKTITRVNQAMYSLLPGDQVLFQRGGKFRGQITIGSSGAAGNNIV